MLINGFRPRYRGVLGVGCAFPDFSHGPPDQISAPTHIYTHIHTTTHIHNVSYGNITKTCDCTDQGTENNPLSSAL